MKLNRILSSVLVVVLMLMSFVGLIPANVEAAYSSSVAASSSLTAAEIKQIVTASYEYKFASAYDMLSYELGMGYLDYVSSEGNQYTIYANRYTGVVYYVNNVTGQILTSNPYNPGVVTSSSNRKKMMSQLELAYLLDTGELAVSPDFFSSEQAGERAQISVSAIKNGIRVNYVMGDTSTRFLVPMQIMADDFLEYVLTPALKYYEEKLEEYIREEFPDAEFDFFAQESWGKYLVYTDNGYIEARALKEYLAQMEEYVAEVFPIRQHKNNPIRIELVEINGSLTSFRTSFNLVDPSKYDLNNETDKTNFELLKKRIAILEKNGPAVYECGVSIVNKSTLKSLQNALSNYAQYTRDLLLEHEEKCKYEYGATEQPVFRCSLEYSFNEDGTLSVRLPANSIVFDESVYNLQSITPLKYFGAGNLSTDGYTFVPDGSGSVISFDDFYTDEFQQNVSISLSVYGDDYCFSTPNGYHKEQVSMPVYGVVSPDAASALTKTHSAKQMVDQGFFAIIEEGASLASIEVRYVVGGGSKLAATYASYVPYAYDEFNVASTAGVSASTYTIVADSRYTGSFTTRYAMLGDAELAGVSGADYYPASYVGMSQYYREYLKSKGELEALENVTDELPLYIEALGSMSVIEKILTFPVNVSKNLTTFEDIITMYSEFSDAQSKFTAKAAEYRERAKEYEDNNKALYDKYVDQAEAYDKLALEMKGITNINFKLTGFANGGMYFTYPSNVKWESSCGGNDGFNKLLSASRDKGFGIYPEFDFLYVSNTAWFDGIDEVSDLSRMVDNRYASKQVYNSVLAVYESVYSMVVSTDALDRLYTGFVPNYDKYHLAAISVSTLGSDLNSNVDPDNTVNREDSISNIVALLNRIANESEYSTMISGGNMYSVGYADHIININTDSSHLIYSSYTVPFTGLVLHGYVNYAGSPLNYSGSPEYDLLRAIENGASPYYILVYDNEHFMKEDVSLNKYYGVNYENWYDDILIQYNKLNKEIGDLQDFEIIDHRVVIAERVIDKDEVAANNALLKAEFIELVEAKTVELINAAFDSMYGDPNQYGRGVSVKFNIEALVEQASRELNISIDELNSLGTADSPSFYDKLVAIAADYAALYPEKKGAYEVVVSAVDYSTKYNYVTDSYADDKDYKFTDYTLDNDRVVVVTYGNAKTGETRTFVLNYNVYGVIVKLDSNTVITLDKYGYQKIEG